VCLCGLALIAAGCTSSESTLPAETTASQAPATAGQSSAAGQVGLEFRSTPDPPASGDNTYEVTVTQADGSPVTDATVTVVFSMPAMPTMGMPAMRSEAPLAHQGSGRYIGKGQLEMNGTWSVLVTASRGADEIGRRSFSVIAK
jgi:nitrogen fixation protein FixH